MAEVVLRVPQDIIRALKIPPDQIPQELQKELALALYRRGVLSSGKACMLAGLTRAEWEAFLAERKVIRHYAERDLARDISYAGRHQ